MRELTSSMTEVARKVSLHCRAKGKLYDQRVCPYNQGLACCTWVSCSRKPATAPTAGRPQSYGQLGEDGPERARAKNRGVSHGHWPCAPKTVPSPSWMPVYICIEMRRGAGRGWTL